ncbi:Zinc/iron permease [Catenaria anguillulae PL171]|uniref:Zinc/iron permease n=1 Tax=Catenaria anguillulae PL171 TaxID=765915 RepID=A0A1Y2HH39_9FUNG|nr:Zinc/iron permease [Catenaria anguillulae PL171]
MAEQGGNNLTAFLVTMFAGLATAVGGACVRFGSLQSPAFLSMSMALAAGVMIHVSYVEILKKSEEAFAEAWPATRRDPNGPKRAVVMANVMFFCGVIFIIVLDKVIDRVQDYFMPDDVPAPHDHHAPPTALSKEQRRSRHRSSMIAPDVLQSYMHSYEQNEKPRSQYGGHDVEHGAKSTTDMSPEQKAKLMRTGLVTALAIGAHNLPEGLATFIAMANGAGSGLPLAVAITIHNIPEGVCVAVPVLYATGSRVKAFLMSLVAGLSEPIGAAIGWAIIASIKPSKLNLLFGIMFGLISGMMIYIALVELLPTAVTYMPNGQGRVAMALWTGIFIMAASLVMFEMAGE